MKLILGSSSPWRKRILKEMGYEFEVVVPGIDEKAIRDPDARKLVLKLAAAKADAIIAKLSEPAIVITSDQVVSFQNKILEKPLTAEENRQMLSTYAGAPLTTVTAVTAVNTQTAKRLSGVDKAVVVFRPIPEEVISDYAASGAGLRQAGGFDVESPLLSPYVVRINGEIESVQGLPKALTKRLLKLAGL